MSKRLEGSPCRRESARVTTIARLIFFTGLLSAVCFATGGCKTEAKPQLANPGSVESQQRRATQFDPFPQPDIGPDVVGARPRDYQQPVAETNRARWLCSPVPVNGQNGQ